MTAFFDPREDFITKDEYLNFRQQWKDAYMEMSRDIRDLKNAHREAAKGGYASACRVQSVRARMSNRAHDMMLELEEVKELSALSVSVERAMQDIVLRMHNVINK